MKTKIVALGDSIIKGVVLSSSGRYTVIDQSYINLIGDELDLCVENYGKFGSTIQCGKAMLERHGDSIAGSDYALLSFGGNDCDFDWMKIAQCPSETHSPKTEIGQFKQQYLSLISELRELGTCPVIVTLPPILSERYFAFLSRTMTESQRTDILEWMGGDVEAISRWHEDYNKAVLEVASLAQTKVVDVTSVFNGQDIDIHDFYCEDGIHPNAAGHMLIAEYVVNRYL